MFFRKLLLRWLFKWAANRAILGRYIDRNAAAKGRLTRRDVARILDRALQNFEQFFLKVDIKQFQTAGNRLLVMLGVASHAMYQVLIDEGFDRIYATELFADVGWKVYEKMIKLPRLIARLRTRDPQEQMSLMLRMFLRFPFSRPGYDYQVLSEEGGFELHFYCCPIQNYFNQVGEEAFLFNSWCMLDYALAQLMVKGGRYKRPHTLSAGDPVCDMVWSVPHPDAFQFTGVDP
jgi:hypothetical protein